MAGAAERLTSDRLYPVCAPAYQGGKPELNTATLLDCAGSIGSWNAWLKTQGKPFSRDEEINRASTYVIAITAAIHGAGMAMAHDTLTADLVAAGSLVRPFRHSAPLAEGYFLFPPPSHGQTPASQAFLDWMREEMSASVTVQQTQIYEVQPVNPSRQVTIPLAEPQGGTGRRHRAAGKSSVEFREHPAARRSNVVPTPARFCHWPVRAPMPPLVPVPRETTRKALCPSSENPWRANQYRHRTPTPDASQSDAPKLRTRNGVPNRQVFLWNPRYQGQQPPSGFHV